MRISIFALCVTLGCVFFAFGAGAQTPPAVGDAPGTIHVFNGKDLTGLYKWIKDRGRDNDPKDVFTVKDGMLRISGEGMGCVTSTDEFENFRVIMEFKWGEMTWAGRKEAARDSGMLVHSKGEDGAYSGVWMHSIECQMIEGGTGDLLVVGDGSDAFQLTAPTAPELDNNCAVYKSGGQPRTITSGRINWWGRDPEWKDVKGFRGKQDVEKAVGEWNRYECVAQGDKITIILNGVTMNECNNVKPHKGRLQIQSEGAEVFVRRLDMVPLPASAAPTPAK
jgi:hypothetical protein